jgi:hypothetical protein
MVAAMHLYRYQPCIDFARIEAVIANRQLYFSSPASFNDPWDCKVFYDNSKLHESETLERHLKFYGDLCRNAGDSEELINQKLGFYRTNVGLFSSSLEEISSLMCEQVEKDYRVYCLSEVSNSELMWSHYSDFHRGLCFEFNAENSLFSSAYKINYTAVFPSVELPDNSIEATLKPFLNKSISWSYEKEWRFIAKETTADIDFGMLITRHNQLIRPIGSLSSVIMGCRFSAENQERLRALLQKVDERVSLKKATRTDNRYELIIEPA